MPFYGIFYKGDSKGTSVPFVRGLEAESLQK
jgi:hypothetical protein